MDSSQPKQDSATIFMKMFIKTIINQTRTARKYRLEYEIPLIKEINSKGNFIIEDVEKVELKNYLLNEIPSPILERETDFLANTPGPPPKKIEKEIKAPQIEEPQIIPANKLPTQNANPKQNQPLGTPKQPNQPEQTIEAGLDNINQILSNPATQSVECQGPDKPLIINTSGKIQPSQTTLSKEKIQKIIKFFSEQTHIPLVTGVFKSILGNLTITAVVSDFIGTRFIIQKKQPALFQQPNQPQRFR